MADHTFNNDPVIDRIAGVLDDYRDGLHDSSEEAAAAVLLAIRAPTEAMWELGDEIIKGGRSASWVWRGMIDRARNA